MQEVCNIICTKCTHNQMNKENGMDDDVASKINNGKETAARDVSNDGEDEVSKLSSNDNVGYVDDGVASKIKNGEKTAAREVSNDGQEEVHKPSSNDDVRLSNKDCISTSPDRQCRVESLVCFEDSLDRVVNLVKVNANEMAGGCISYLHDKPINDFDICELQWDDTKFGPCDDWMKRSLVKRFLPLIYSSNCRISCTVLS